MFVFKNVLLVLWACNDTSSQTEEEPPAQEITEPTVSQESEPIPIVGELPIWGSREIWVETIFYEDAIPHHIFGTRMLFHQNGEALYFDEANETTISLGDFDHVAGIGLDTQYSMFLLDGQAYTYDGQWLAFSSINDALPIPVEKIHGHRESLWLQGGGQLYWYHEETLQSVTTDNQHMYLFSYGGLERSAIAAPQLRILDTSSNLLTLADYRNDLLPTHMTYDDSETLWVSDGSSLLYQKDKNRRWSAVQTTSSIRTIKGNPKSTDVWIQLEDTTILHQNGTFFEVDLPDGDWKEVDEYGRLLIQTEDSVLRVSSARTVAVAGIMHHEILEGATTLTFVPTMQESLEHMYAWIDQQPLDIDSLQQAFVDSNDLMSGLHSLRILAIGPEGESITEIPFYVGSLPDVKWQDGIDSLTQAHCNDCHGEGSFLPLNTAALWQENIEVILSEVINNEMPKGGPYLSADEIQMIRGWKNGGFQ